MTTTKTAPTTTAKIALSYRDVTELYGLGRRTILRMVATGRFPKPRQVGPRRVLFDAAELEAWFQAQPRAGED